VALVFRFDPVRRIVHATTVSVIIPFTPARQEFLFRALSSIYNGREKPEEILILLDGNKEELWSSFAKELRKQPSFPLLNLLCVDSLPVSSWTFENIFPEKLSLREGTQGPARLRNKGAQDAKGEVLAFLDSDDEWEEEKLSVMKKCFENPNVILAHSDEMWRKNGQLLTKKVKHTYTPGDERALFEKCMISTSTLMVRRSAFLRLGGYPKSLYVAEDYALALKFLGEGDWVYFKDKLTRKHAEAEDQIGFPPEGILGHRLSALSDLFPFYGRKNPKWQSCYRESFLRSLRLCEKGLEKKGKKLSLEIIKPILEVLKES